MSRSAVIPPTGRTSPGPVPDLTADAVAMGRDFAFAIVPAS
jgi:hypothetical protein